MRVLLVLLALTVLGACANSEPRKRLADAVHSMNDAARWGRINTSVNLVEPAYKMRFMTSHREWGETVQLADSEVIHVEYAPDGNKATALVTYSWYNLRTMTLHKTEVMQQWVTYNDDFALSDEKVIKGDASLFAEPPPKG